MIIAKHRDSPGASVQQWGVQRAAESPSPKADEIRIRQHRSAAEVPARPEAAIASGTAADTRRSVELKVNCGCERDVWAE